MLESVMENEIHKFLWDFGIQMDHLWVSLNKFPDFFRMASFIDSTHMKL